MFTFEHYCYLCKLRKKFYIFYAINDLFQADRDRHWNYIWHYLWKRHLHSSCPSLYREGMAMTPLCVLSEGDRYCVSLWLVVITSSTKSWQHVCGGDMESWWNISSLPTVYHSHDLVLNCSANLLCWLLCKLYSFGLVPSPFDGTFPAI